MPLVAPIRLAGDAVELLDQRALPNETCWIRCVDASTTAAAIQQMVVRGAPAIGVAAAYGFAFDVLAGGDRGAAKQVLMASRPTAVNLRWALERMAVCPDNALLAEATAIHAEDVRINRALGDHGAALLPENARVYHHCNTGSLATGGWGTALGVIRSAHVIGKLEVAYLGETRPYLQGARLSAYECVEEGIPCTLVTDSTAAALFAAAKVDAVVVGCDRVAANGDTANKIGTLGLAVLAKHYGIPFYVCMPTSTLDRRCPTGAKIPIEQRDPEEVRGFRDVIWAPEVDVYNPAFDVTPAALVTAWVTERGVWRAPFPEID
jgi:methylthioribose-1-phosphate isomerase